MLIRMAVELDDRALMLRYKDGDVAAFETLYQRHRGPLYRFLLNQSQDTQAAEDIFQEVWSRIIRSRDRYRPAAKFATYMYHIARNCFLDHVRHSGRQPVLVSIDDDPPVELVAVTNNPEAAAENSNASAYIQAALDGLPPEQREAFLLREEAGLTLEEIGQVTGVGRETVKSRLRYAVAKLRKSLPVEVANPLTGTDDDR
ncbi:MAG: RNA polymerase sigma factor [Gammaproteobacteria bacterium]